MLFPDQWKLATDGMESSELAAREMPDREYVAYLPANVQYALKRRPKAPRLGSSSMPGCPTTTKAALRARAQPRHKPPKTDQKACALGLHNR